MQKSLFTAGPSRSLNNTLLHYQILSLLITLVKSSATSNAAVDVAAVVVATAKAVVEDTEARGLEAPDSDRISATYQLLAARVGQWTNAKKPLLRAGMVH